MNQKAFFIQITLAVALIPTTLCAMEPTMQATHWTILKKNNNTNSTKVQSSQDYWTRHGLIQRVEPQQQHETYTNSSIQTEESPQDNYWTRLKKTQPIDNTGDIQSIDGKEDNIVIELDSPELSPRPLPISPLAISNKKTEESQLELKNLTIFREIDLIGFHNQTHLNTLCQKQRALEQLTTNNNDTLKQHQQGLIEELNKISCPNTKPTTKSSFVAFYKLTSLLNVLQKRGWTNQNFKLPQGENIVNMYREIINKTEEYLEQANQDVFARITNSTLPILPFEQNHFIDPMDQLDAMCNQLKTKLDSHYNHTANLKAFHTSAISEIRHLMGEKN